MLLTKVINATGTVLHTNLGRAPFGKELLEETSSNIIGYNNLEFDLKAGKRGHRDILTKEILKKVTGAENSTIVNNNASAVFLVLNTLAQDREVIVSRSELVEIGGCFRIPDIMASSGAKMVEVGSVNSTTLSDYEEAITENTALILKVHRSNFKIFGNFSEVSTKELAELSRKHKIPFVYDLGSGLLRKPEKLQLPENCNVRDSIHEGVSIVTFSGDKLLGGPQAGIIAGDEKLVDQCISAPMMRAMRVGKLTISMLSTIMQRYINDPSYCGPILEVAKTPFDVFSRRALKLKKAINNLIDKDKANATIINSKGSIGGGTLPQYFFKTKAVALDLNIKSRSHKEKITSECFHKLMTSKHPVISVLREGQIIFDVCTISDDNLSQIAESIKESID